MLIDQTIDLPSGTVKFVGEVTPDELDFIIKMGLVTLYLRGELSTTVVSEDGTILADVPELLQ